MLVIQSTGARPIDARSNTDGVFAAASAVKATPAAHWRVTLGNAEQTLEFQTLVSSPMGRAASNTCGRTGSLRFRICQ